MRIVRFLLCLASATAITMDLRAQPGALDPSFDPGAGPDSVFNVHVLRMALQPDGKVLIVGNFPGYNGIPRPNAARLNNDGSLDTGFDPGAGADDLVRNVLVQPDGKVVVGGDFITFNNTGGRGVARLLADGSMDAGFNTGTGVLGSVHALALQPDGKLLVAGYFNSVNGVPRSKIARLNTDGSVDTSFDTGTGADSYIFSVAVQADGRILIGGDFQNYQGQARTRLARLNADGSLDTGFDVGSGADSYVRCLLVQPDGRILVGGDFITFNGTSCRRIVRLEQDGSLDPAFATFPGANNDVLALDLQPDGRILAAGSFNLFGQFSYQHLVRLLADGTLDSELPPGTGTNTDLADVALQPDGRILVSGWFFGCNGTTRRRIARLFGGSSVGIAPPMERSGLLLHPVPVSDQLVLQLNATGMVTLTLLDNQGRALRTETQAMGQGNMPLVWDLGALLPGYYSVRMVSDDGWQAASFIKE